MQDMSFQVSLKSCQGLSLPDRSGRVISLWLFYMQASMSWTWCELQPEASAWIYIKVWHGFLGLLKTSQAAAFWIICKGLIVMEWWKSSQKSIAVVQSRNDKGLDKKLCSIRRIENTWSFWCCAMPICKIERFLQHGLWKSADHRRLHQNFWLNLMG